MHKPIDPLLLKKKINGSSATQASRAGLTGN
jgi:hypothetical protein